MFFFKKDLEKCAFVIYYSMAIYTPLVGQKKFEFVGPLGGGWTRLFWVFLGQDFVVGKVIFDFS